MIRTQEADESQAAASDSPFAGFVRLAQKTTQFCPFTKAPNKCILIVIKLSLSAQGAELTTNYEQQLRINHHGQQSKPDLTYILLPPAQAVGQCYLSLNRPSTPPSPDVACPIRRYIWARTTKGAKYQQVNGCFLPGAPKWGRTRTACHCSSEKPLVV